MGNCSSALSAGLQAFPESPVHLPAGFPADPPVPISLMKSLIGLALVFSANTLAKRHSEYSIM